MAYNGLGGDNFMNQMGMNPAEVEKRRRLAQQQQQGQVVAPVAPKPVAPAYDPAASQAALAAKSAELDKQSSDLFNTYRQRAQQQGQVAKQSQGEALKRRFASIGNLNSGAYIKAAGLQDQEADKAVQQSIQDVDLQEQQQKVAGIEAEKNRQFQGSQFDRQFDLQMQQFKQSQASDRLNALTAISSLSDEALKSQSGIQDFQGGFLGTGDNRGKVAAINKVLQQYGYA